MLCSIRIVHNIHTLDTKYTFWETYFVSKICNWLYLGWVLRAQTLCLIDAAMTICSQNFTVYTHIIWRCIETSCPISEWNSAIMPIKVSVWSWPCQLSGLFFVPITRELFAKKEKKVVNARTRRTKRAQQATCLLPCISAKSFSANCEWVRPEDTKTLSPSCRRLSHNKRENEKQKYQKRVELCDGWKWRAAQPPQHFWVKSACAGWSVAFLTRWLLHVPSGKTSLHDARQE